MNITITGRHLNVANDLKDHAEKEISKLQRFYKDIIDVQMTMAVERHRHRVEITAHIHDHTLRASGESGDMYTSIDGAAEKLGRQLRKFHGKFREPPRVDKEKILAAALEEAEEEVEEEVEEEAEMEAAE